MDWGYLFWNALAGVANEAARKVWRWLVEWVRPAVNTDAELEAEDRTPEHPAVELAGKLRHLRGGDDDKRRSDS